MQNGEWRMEGENLPSCRTRRVLARRCRKSASIVTEPLESRRLLAAAPAVELRADAAVPFGQVVWSSGTVAGEAGASYTITADFGDGTPAESFSLDLDFGSEFTLSH